MCLVKNIEMMVVEEVPIRLKLLNKVFLSHTSRSICHLCISIGPNSGQRAVFESIFNVTSWEIHRSVDDSSCNQGRVFIFIL